MHFSSLFLASLSAAATVKAAKGGNSIKFELGIIRADMELAVGAINGSVLANLPSEDKINCKDPARSGQTATFYLDKEALFLYSEGLNQEIYVDFSPQGQGKIGYTTGDQQPPNDSTPDGWQITEDNHLQFNNKDVIACHNGQGDASSGEGSFTLFAPLDGIVENPKAPQGKDCGSGVIKIHKDESPVLCTY